MKYVVGTAMVAVIMTSAIALATTGPPQEEVQQVNVSQQPAVICGSRYEVYIHDVEGVELVVLPATLQSPKTEQATILARLVNYTVLKERSADEASLAGVGGSKVVLRQKSCTPFPTKGGDPNVVRAVLAQN